MLTFFTCLFTDCGFSDIFIEAFPGEELPVTDLNNLPGIFENINNPNKPIPILPKKLLRFKPDDFLISVFAGFIKFIF